MSRDFNAFRLHHVSLKEASPSAEYGGGSTSQSQHHPQAGASLDYLPTASMWEDLERNTGNMYQQYGPNTNSLLFSASSNNGRDFLPSGCNIWASAGVSRFKLLPGEAVHPNMVPVIEGIVGNNINVIVSLMNRLEPDVSGQVNEFTERTDGMLPEWQVDPLQTITPSGKLVSNAASLMSQTLSNIEMPTFSRFQQTMDIQLPFRMSNGAVQMVQKSVTFVAESEGPIHWIDNRRRYGWRNISTTLIANDDSSILHKRNIVQVIYRNWPDNEQPMETGISFAPDDARYIEFAQFLHFLYDICGFYARRTTGSGMMMELPAQVMIHCAAGIGRTGTLSAAIAFFSPINPASHSIEYFVSRMREARRARLVYTRQQLGFLQRLARAVYFDHATLDMLYEGDGYKIEQFKSNVWRYYSHDPVASMERRIESRAGSRRGGGRSRLAGVATEDLEEETGEDVESMPSFSLYGRSQLPYSSSGTRTPMLSTLSRRSLPTGMPMKLSFSDNDDDDDDEILRTPSSSSSIRSSSLDSSLLSGSSSNKMPSTSGTASTAFRTPSSSSSVGSYSAAAAKMAPLSFTPQSPLTPLNQQLLSQSSTIPAPSTFSTPPKELRQQQRRSKKSSSSSSAASASARRRYD